MLFDVRNVLTTQIIFFDFCAKISFVVEFGFQQIDICYHNIRKEVLQEYFVIFIRKYVPTTKIVYDESF